VLGASRVEEARGKLASLGPWRTAISVAMDETTTHPEQARGEHWHVFGLELSQAVRRGTADEGASMRAPSTRRRARRYDEEPAERTEGGQEDEPVGRPPEAQPRRVRREASQAVVPRRPRRFRPPPARRTRGRSGRQNVRMRRMAMYSKRPRTLIVPLNQSMAERWYSTTSASLEHASAADPSTVSAQSAPVSVSLDPRLRRRCRSPSSSLTPAS
jgi:hypothetical protein